MPSRKPQRVGEIKCVILSKLCWCFQEDTGSGLRVHLDDIWQATQGIPWQADLRSFSKVIKNIARNTCLRKTVWNSSQVNWCCIFNSPSMNSKSTINHAAKFSRKLARDRITQELHSRGSKDQSGTWRNKLHSPLMSRPTGWAQANKIKESRSLRNVEDRKECAKSRWMTESMESILPLHSLGFELVQELSDSSQQAQGARSKWAPTPAEQEG